MIDSPRDHAASGSSSKRPSPTALVTGGSRGIGRAICIAFSTAGWRVGVHYRERKREADQTAEAINRSGGQTCLYQADIRQSHQVEAMVQDCVARWGRLDVLVANAGISSGRLLLRLDCEEWNSVIESNLTGTFHCVKAAGSHMVARGGSIVVVGSFAGLQGHAGQSAYAASKAGLLGLVKTAAREWGRENVRINAVLPGWHRTEMTDAVRQDGGMFTEHSLGRSSELSAVAKTIYHLATLKDVSGQVWNLDSRILSS
jgi:3-oxoacyl-[acyl-carrier protein] reductase